MTDITVNPGWQFPEFEYKDDTRGKAFYLSNFPFGTEIQVKFANGKTKNMRIFNFEPVSKYQEDKIIGEFEPTKFYKIEYDGYDDKTGKSLYKIVYEYENFKNSIIGVRRAHVEHLKNALESIKVGDIVRFKGHNDHYSFREIVSINYRDDLFQTVCVGRKCTFAVKTKEIFRHSIMSENMIIYAIEKAIVEDGVFKDIETIK